MKKFTKGCLLTALVIFVLGCVVCGVSGLLGGFRQLENISETTGIPFRYHRGADGSVEFGFFDSQGNDWTIGTEEVLETIESGAPDSEKQLALTADTLRNLEVDLEGCALAVRESEDEHVWLAVEGSGREVHYAVENGDTLVIDTPDPILNWPGLQGAVNKTVVYLALPKDAELDAIELECGAGKIDMSDLKADSIDIELGAGACSLEALTARTVVLSVGAGEASVGTLTAKETELEVGAGELVIEAIRNDGILDLDIGMGNAEINGIITGEMDLDCSMGNVTMKLAGSEEDYLYTIDCAMGNVTVGDNVYASFVGEKQWGNGENCFDIDCSMGSVTIIFEEP